MRVLRENPFLLVWLIVLTCLVVINFFYTKVDVNLNIKSEEGLKVAVKKNGVEKI